MQTSQSNSSTRNMHHRRGRLVFSGSPYQQAVWQRAMERRIRKDAANLQIEARKLFCLADRIAVERQKRTRLRDDTLCRVLHSNASTFSKQYVKRLAGLDPSLPCEDAINVIVDGSTYREKSAVPPNALQQAAAIVRRLSAELDEEQSA